MIGHWIKEQMRAKEKEESDGRVKYLISLPINTFAAIYADCDGGAWAGSTFNGTYYSELEIYYASLDRDEGYEVLL